MAQRNEIKQETSLRDFLNVVFRRKWVILAVVGLASFLVFFLSARQPNMWGSHCKILVSRGEQTSLLYQQVRYLSWEEEASSHIQVILSDAVFTRATEMFKDSLQVHGYPEHWQYNPGAVRADVVGESNAYVISYVDVMPDACQLGCGATTAAFKEFYEEVKSPPELADFFAEELATVREELDQWRTRRQNFLNETQFYGTDETSNFLLLRIVRLEGSLSEVTGDVSSMQIRVDNLEELRHKTGAELERKLAFSTRHAPLQTSVVQRIKEQLQRKNIQRDELRQKYTEKHPELMAITDQIATLHADLERQVDNAYRVDKETLDGMKGRKAQLEGELIDKKSQLNTIPDKERTVAEIDNMISKLEKKHEVLLSKQSESDIALASRPDWEVSVLTPSSPPSNSKKNDPVRLLLGPLLAMIVGLGIAFFLESADHSIRNSADVEEYLEVPVLATVTEMKPRKSA
jgi:succinoglycan biosynthesis transport protein ExoP